MTAAQIIGLIVVCSLILAAAEIASRYQNAKPEQPSAFDSAKLQSEIAALYHASQELETLDSMIIDLRLCKPEELHRAFRVEWQGSTKAHSYDFMSTGANSNTAHMIALAEDQREQLNADIQSRIADLYSRAQEIEIFGQCREHIGEQNEPTGERT